MKRIHSCKGFTLIELVVASGVFSIIITIAVAALFSAQNVNIRLEKTQKILDGVNLATEVMVRDIRYGSLFYCDTGVPVAATVRKNCPYTSGLPGATLLVFKPTNILTGSTNSYYDRVAYHLDNGAIFKIEYPYGTTPRTYQITSSDVVITSLSFYSVGLNSVTGSSDFGNATDLQQPFITFAISGTTAAQGRVAPVTFTVQTSSVSRSLDN